MSEEYIENTQENAEDTFEDIIKVVDDDGKEHDFIVVDAIETDDGRYIALLPCLGENEEVESDEDETILIFEVAEENGEEVLAEIESDEVYESVAAIFEERLDDLYNGDIEDEE